MSEIVEYLQCEQAREDVRMVLGEFGDSGLPSKDIGGKFWECGKLVDSPWYVVEVNCVASVYYRQRGDRFIVSDLGDGMRSRRLRSGEWNLDEDPADRLTTGVTDDKATLIHGMVVWRRDATIEDLPEAIRLVMLASCCIANLDE